ncbi:hypothetical protein ACPA54_08710 [Uniformispora flossi]|uniref:hypothetical protein n=1 Tax=Uniformispora flossi TaxID=3390723 RepID=UPI003C2B3DF3
MSPYVVPAVIATACAAGLTAAVRRVRRVRDARRAAEARNEEFGPVFVPEARDSRGPEPGAGAAEDAESVLTEAEAAPEPVPADAFPPLRSTTPHPSQGLAPMLPPQLTGAHLQSLAARRTAVTGLRSGTAGGLDVFDFADGGSLVVMPADPEIAAQIAGALKAGREVHLLGTSEVGSGRSLTFLVGGSTAYCLADRVYARPGS